MAAFDLKGQIVYCLKSRWITMDINGSYQKTQSVWLFWWKKSGWPTDGSSNLRVNSSNSGNSKQPWNTQWSWSLKGDVYGWNGSKAQLFLNVVAQFLMESVEEPKKKKYVQDGIPYYLLESRMIAPLLFWWRNCKWFWHYKWIVCSLHHLQMKKFITFILPTVLCLDSTIIDVAIGWKDREAWLQWDRGLQVFRSDATSAWIILFGQL